MSSSAERIGNLPGTAHRDDSERGRIVMNEVSWLSDYVSATQRTSDRPGATAGQGIAGLMGIGLEADAQSWQERALCAETDPEAFFPEKGGSTREAKKICTGCEVKAECLEYALSNDERFGIWGGLSERERRRLRRRAV
ncbi:MAG: transcription factor WhiB [Blastococcus sp.]|jgi:WhiB family redox-sensing transcriptional regulator|nr:transcription factor WhiB [Blastococcus sp.]